MQQIPRDIDHLKKLVLCKIIDKWDSIAIQLEFDVEQIKKIKENQPELSMEKSCQKMLWGWLDSSPRNEIRAHTLIEAIKDVDCVECAENIEKGLQSFFYLYIANFKLQTVRY